VLDGGRDLKLIDFEGAFEPDREEPTYIFTPGFASYKDIVRQEYRFESDYYSFGTLLLAYVMPVNGMVAFDASAPQRFARAIGSDFGLPEVLVEVVGGLMAAEPADRLTPWAACDLLEAAALPDRAPVLQARADLRAECARVLARTVEHLGRVATPERSDRLFPADPKVFVTNPLSVAYGACGVAYALKAITGAVPAAVDAWIRKQPRDERSCPPGLYLGLAGVAWTLWELGHHEEALGALAASATHPRLHSASDVFYGSAGWGLAQLAFLARTGDWRHADAAVAAGEAIARAAREEEGRLHWPGERGEVTYGFAHGASGIAVFLLSLHEATGDDRWLALGRRALEFDLDAAEPNAEGASTWRMARRPDAPTLPYLRYGTAGVGLAVVRYLRKLGDARYREALDGLLPDTERKYAIFPGRFVGLAGVGEFLLDLQEVPGFEARARAALERLVTGLLLFQVETEQGLAFPGYELYRLSCDLGTGSAGIALFLRRYLDGGPHDFLVDELSSSAVRPVSLTNGTQG
jgi:class III lanthionine synthetase